MRIVAGRWRGRRISAPPGDGVRPTGDRVRESWMSILHHRLPESRVLDLCAGSGALGLEALSRGAVHCDFVESSRASLVVLEENIHRLGQPDGASVHRVEAVQFVSGLAQYSYDVAFADPPYGGDVAEQLVELWLEVPFAHVFGVEHSSKVSLPAPGRSRRYGSTSLTFYHSAES